MIMKTMYLMTAAAVALIGFSAVAQAETVTTTVNVQQKEIPDVNKVNLIVFDTDKNGILSMKEVGQYLFDVFDNDKNGSIDNIEFKQKRFMTIIPMEKETTLQVDFNDDGIPEKGRSH
jgi:Ca2+-binding EF-hand superfamily protein